MEPDPQAAADRIGVIGLGLDVVQLDQFVQLLVVAPLGQVDGLGEIVAEVVEFPGVRSGVHWKIAGSMPVFQGSRGPSAEAM